MGYVHPNNVNVNLIYKLVGARDLRTLWSPPVSLNQEGHTKAQSSLFFFENSLKSPPWKHTWWSEFLSFLFFIFMYFLFYFVFIWMQVWSLEKEDTPHSFSNKVFFHYYKFYFFLFFQKIKIKKEANM
jgi:hypothetical protein